MPRLNLTDAEAQLIRERREHERHFVSGYNLALESAAEEADAIKKHPTENLFNTQRIGEWLLSRKKPLPPSS